MTAGRRAGAGRLAGWSCFLALTLRLLHGAEFARLSIPLGSLDELAAWADQTSPTVMALAVVRLAALLTAWYLTGATILAVVADVAGWRRLAAVVAALSPSLVRRLASRSAGVGLAAGALLAVTPMPQRLIAAPASASTGTDPADPTGISDPPSAMTPPAPGPAGPGAPTGSAGSAGSAATMTRLPDATDPARGLVGDPPAATTLPPRLPPRSSQAGGAEPARPPQATMTRLPVPTIPGSEASATMTQIAWSPDTPGDTPASHASQGSHDTTEPWTVAAGDSFWSIAEEILTDLAGHQPTEQAIRRYWVQLIETNRRRLADPANPDLLIPGQLLDLPDPA